MHLKQRHEQWLVRINPRPQTQHISQGRAVLATNSAGWIEGASTDGFFAHETRMLSRYLHLIDGKPPLKIACSPVEQHSWLGYYGVTPPGLQWPKDTGSGAMEPVSEETIELRVSRTVGFGLHEDIDITDFTQTPSEFDFAIELDADFADQAEIDERQQKGKLQRQWKRAGSAWELVFDYRASHRYWHQGNWGKGQLHRKLTLRIENAGSKPSYEDGRIHFPIKLKPGEPWHVCIKMIPEIEGKKLPVLYGCHDFFADDTELDRRRHLFLNEATHFRTKESETLSSVVIQALRQAKNDLAALRLYDLDADKRDWTMAAGLPIYVALFGRDTLTASWQSALISPAMMRGTLPELVKWQGREVNDWRDEQPGRMLHEAHTGPLATLGYNPRTRYYGATTTSSFFPVVAAELWHWTGDKSLVKPLIAPALRALRWKDEYADLRGDGFSYYKTRSRQGNKNQAWKDSGDAIVYEDGREVETPIATCEEQAYVYVSKMHMAELLLFMGEIGQARKLFREASDLKERFNEKFWMQKEQYFVLGLDSRGRPIRSIASNPGHCLAAGIVDQDYVLPTARRLTAEELFTGWGVRTLSSQHPAFDPYSYHRGAVWPVEQGSFALGFVRYGLHRELEQLARAVFESTTLFEFRRLPECFSGHQRDRQHPFPALYPKTNWPQAWSASALFTVIQAMLGIYPIAALNVLLLDPHLPDWLPEITLEQLHVGKAEVSLRFYREKDKTHFQVLDKRGKLRVVRQPSPWSLTATFGERFRDAIESLAA